ncbi:hypothetical protein GGD56_007077 [Rhizobium mongolense]|uniref:Uncharacterized protein n=2 Tax=Rhizobium mongolense TaxID=57676 RepID=A0ABR6IZ43_9HYPH|nr:hypothetical protein [Rhizobium mongolense]TVZ75281.1 hypothetical protein BCL32_0755 [Rhizobium mongolense USDA 1844]
MTIIKTAYAIIVAGTVATAFVAEASDLVSVPHAPAIAASPSPWQLRLRALGAITSDSGRVDRLAGSDLIGRIIWGFGAVPQIWRQPQSPGHSLRARSLQTRLSYASLKGFSAMHR